MTTPKSKKPKPGGKGLRCKVYVNRLVGNSEIALVLCDRPAKRFGQQVKAFWKDGDLLDVGTIDCCINHADQLRRQGVILTQIQRRRIQAPKEAK